MPRHKPPASEPPPAPRGTSLALPQRKLWCKSLQNQAKPLGLASKAASSVLQPGHVLPSLKQAGEFSRLPQSRRPNARNAGGERCQPVGQQPNRAESQVTDSPAALPQPRHKTEPFWPFRPHRSERWGNQTRITQKGAALGRLPRGCCRARAPFSCSHQTGSAPCPGQGFPRSDGEEPPLPALGKPERRISL